MTQRIPNSFHFVFGLKKQTEPFHLAYYLALESCIRINKPERVYLYYHYMPYGRYWNLIRDKLKLVEVDLVPCVSEFKYQDRYIRNNFLYAHHSDFIRVQKLIEHGGVYADIDTLFVSPLPEKLFRKSAVMGWEDDVTCTKTGNLRPSVCNAFIMLEKNGEFGKKYISEMAGRLDGTWSNHSCFLACDLSQRHPNLIHLEPRESFYKHSWTPEGISTLLEGLDEDFERVYSMHLWSHLWWSRKRTDFTRFHAGLLSEDYIRRVDTTYNVVARQFLPQMRKSWFFNRKQAASLRTKPL